MTTTEKKAFTVFWEDATPPSAIVLAENFPACMDIASTYGTVKSIHSESRTVITEPKPVEEPIHV